MQILVKHTSMLGSKLNAWLSQPKKLTGAATKASGEVLATLLSKLKKFAYSEKNREVLKVWTRDKKRKIEILDLVGLV